MIYLYFIGSDVARQGSKIQGNIKPISMVE